MEKINIAELLKDCPKGMELDCTMYEDVYFDYVDELNIIHCYIQHKTHKTSLTFNQHGTPNSDYKSKCVIFPKGKTTWEGFAPFVAGDVIYTDNFIAILSHITEDGAVWHHCYYCIPSKTFKAKRDFVIGNINYHEFRLATDEEKQKLFDAIKENGYKWNAETKTLEKLPKFKVGDRIKKKGIDDVYAVEIAEVTQTIYTFKNGSQWGIESVDKDYELVPSKFDINTLNPLRSEVLVRDYLDGMWKPAFWGKYLEDSDYNYLTTMGCYKQCIPYKGNEHLLGTIDNCDEYFKIWE